MTYSGPAIFRAIIVLGVLLMLGGCGLFVSTDDRVRRADELLAKGQYAEALIELETALSEEPGNARAQLLLAKGYTAMGNQERAAKALDAAVAAGIAPQEAMQVRADLLLQTGKFEELLKGIDDGSLALAEPALSTLRAQALNGLDRCDEAIALARKVLSAHPGPSIARVAVADCYARRGNPDRALAEMNAAVEDFEEDAHAWVFRGRLLQIKGDKPQAEASWKQAAKFAPGRLAVPVQVAMLSELGELQAERGDLRGLRDTSERLSVLVPQSVQTILLRARVLMLEGKPGEAVNALRPVVADHPKILPAHVLLGSAYIAQGNLEQARKQLGIAAQLAPESVNLKNALELVGSLGSLKPDSEDYLLRAGGAQIALMQFNLARMDLEKATKIAPNSFRAGMALVELDLRADNPSAALERVQALAKRHPTEPGIKSLLAKALTSARRFAEADRVLEELGKIAPHQKIALGQYRVRRSGSLGSEYEPLEKWLAASPQDLVVRGALADALRVEGETVRSIAEYEKVVKAAPTSVLALNNLAWLYAVVGDARAEELARRAWELAPKNPVIMDTYGWILVERGSVKEGLPLLEAANQALGLAQPAVRFHFATALAQSGERERARQLLQSLLMEFGEFDDRPAAAKLLADLQG